MAGIKKAESAVAIVQVGDNASGAVGPSLRKVVGTRANGRMGSTLEFGTSWIGLNRGERGELRKILWCSALETWLATTFMVRKNTETIKFWTRVEGTMMKLDKFEDKKLDQGVYLGILDWETSTCQYK